jgi:hypothetical protein
MKGATHNNGNGQVALTPQQASDISGIAVGTLANWRSRRVGPPYYKLRGRKVLYPYDEFIEWLFRQRILTKDSL